MADKPGREIKISPVSAPPVQGTANEDEKSLRVPGVVAPPVQGAENEAPMALAVRPVIAPPVQGGENEADLDFEIPLIDLKETQPGAEDEPDRALAVRPVVAPPVAGAENEALRRQAFLFAEATWVPSADPLVAGPKNLSEMQNLRFTEYGLEGAPGYTKINATTALSTYLKIRSGIQLRAPFTTKSRVLVQAYNTGLTAAQVLQNITAIPNQGDFEAAALHTDAAGAGLGRFAKWPGNQIAYCNGVESKIYGGDEIPCAAFLTSTAAVTGAALTNPKDYSERVRNSLQTSDEVAVIGGGNDANTMVLLAFEEKDGANIKDTSIGGAGAHDASLVGTADWTTNWAKFGTRSGAINAAGDAFSIADHADLDWGAGHGEIDFWLVGHSAVYKVASGSFTYSAIAQVDTITLTGTSGTAIVTLAGGLTRTVTFDTDLPTTASNFVTAFAADYLAQGIVLTSSTADIIFTANVAGTGFVHPVITPSTGDLDGSVANTTPNTSEISGIAGDFADFAVGDAFGAKKTGETIYYAGHITAKAGDSSAITVETNLTDGISLEKVGAAAALCGRYQDATNYWYLAIPTGLDGFTFCLADNGTPVFYAIDNSNYSSDTAGKHIALVQDHDDTELSLYVAGVKTVIGAFELPDLAAALTFGRCQWAAATYAPAFHDSGLYYDEIRCSKGKVRWVSDFSPPSMAYKEAARYFLAGFTRPVQAVKFYLTETNTATSALTLKENNGHSWALLSPTDGTLSGAVSLGQTGSVSFLSTVDSSRPKLIEGRVLYWYQFALSDGEAQIYQVTGDAPWQDVRDCWDGTELLLASCLVYDAANSAYEDYTLYASEGSAATPVVLDGLLTTEHALLGSPVELMGFHIEMTSDTTKVNDNAATMTVAYCDGSAIADWPAVISLTDLTSASSKSLKQSGTVSFMPIAAGQQFTAAFNGGESFYYYKLTFSALLSAAVEAIQITGIPAPQRIRGYKFPFMFLGRPMLCGYLAGNEGNRVDYGMTHGADVWNGPDSSFGVDNESLYFGGGEDLTAACEVYNRLGSSIYSFAIFTKDYETYILNGYGTGEAPYRIYPVSSVIGCPAALTMDTWQIGISADAQSVRSIAMWLSHQGPVLFDSGGLMPVPGLECYFDRRDARCVNYAAIANARGWFDPETGDYNLQMPTGASTVNNVWVALNLKIKKWYPVVPSVAITFANGTHEAVVGEAVHQAVTGATGTVLAVTVSSGTWAGGTAAGTILLKETSGTWAAGNNMEDAAHTVIASCTACTTDPFLGAAFRVYDTAGKGYAYGGRDNGRMMRLHNGVTWDGTATVESVTPADLLVSNDPWDVIRLNKLKLFGISTAEDTDAAITHYADGAAAGTALTAVALNGANRIFRSTQALNLLAWSHRITISAQFATEAKGLRLLGWALEYQVERADY